MMRLIRGINGILVVDKPPWISSYDVVRELKPGMRGVKIGYLGTLDPVATGVLPLLLGEGTKLAPFLEEGTKVYEATLHLGITTDTQDKEGKILRSVDVADYDISPPRLEAVIHQFRGRIKQLPPMYSALKYKGEPLYKLARKGETIHRSPRGVEIHGLRIMDIEPPLLELHIECSKGTYVRTLAHDIGEHLGCGAHLVALRRTRSGPFAIEGALPLGQIKGLIRHGRLQEHVLSLSRAVGFLPAVVVGRDAARAIQNGQTVNGANVPRGSAKGERTVRVLADKGGGLVAVGEIQRGKDGLTIRPLRVFHDALFTNGPSCDKDILHPIAHNTPEQGGR
jgi:tRNA pseudouridine55 synthase